MCARNFCVAVLKPGTSVLGRLGAESMLGLTRLQDSGAKEAGTLSVVLMMGWDKLPGNAKADPGLGVRPVEVELENNSE